MELNTKQETVLLHLKDNEPVAVTLSNGSHTLYMLKEADRKAVEDFYEVNKVQD